LSPVGELPVRADFESEMLAGRRNLRHRIPGNELQQRGGDEKRRE
jgi:hypothetical protein